jgi:hypothetical protein
MDGSDCPYTSMSERWSLVGALIERDHLPIVLAVWSLPPPWHPRNITGLARRPLRARSRGNQCKKVTIGDPGRRPHNSLSQGNSSSTLRVVRSRRFHWTPSWLATPVHCTPRLSGNTRTTCSFDWWLVVDVGLFWDKRTAGWLLVAGLFWEKSIDG